MYRNSTCLEEESLLYKYSIIYFLKHYNVYYIFPALQYSLVPRLSGKNICVLKLPALIKKQVSKISAIWEIENIVIINWIFTSKHSKALKMF